jgi:hypothetical protein
MDCMNNPPRQITPSGRIISNQGHNGSAPLKDLAMNGLLPTPTAIETPRKPDRIQELKDKNLPLMSMELGDNNRQVGILDTMDFYGVLPTPNTRDWKDSIGNGKDAPSIGLTRGYSLGQKINSMLATPAASDWKGAYRPESMKNKDGTFSREERLVNIYLKTGEEYNSKTSQLSPHFVMEMMGFPIDHTMLPFQKIETQWTEI